MSGALSRCAAAARGEQQGAGEGANQQQVGSGGLSSLHGSSFSVKNTGPGKVFPARQRRRGRGLPRMPVSTSGSGRGGRTGRQRRCDGAVGLDHDRLAPRPPSTTLSGWIAPDGEALDVATDTQLQQLRIAGAAHQREAVHAIGRHDRADELEGRDRQRGIDRLRGHRHEASVPAPSPAWEPQRPAASARRPHRTTATTTWPTARRRAPPRATRASGCDASRKPAWMSMWLWSGRRRLVVKALRQEDDQRLKTFVAGERMNRIAGPARDPRRHWRRGTKAACFHRMRTSIAMHRDPLRARAASITSPASLNGGKGQRCC